MRFIGITAGRPASPARDPLAQSTRRSGAGFGTSKPYRFEPFTPTLPEAVGQFS
jgi:hypothetical protein